jgi:hypothetical protein
MSARPGPSGGYHAQWYPYRDLDLAASGDRIGVVEANCFNASRFYAAVVERVLRAVNAFVLSHQ